MPIDSKHVDYQELEADYEMIYDILKGQRQIKEKGVEYLPMLEGQDTTEYTSFLERGVFYNAFSRTVKGMTGNLIRRPVEVSVPKSMNEYLDHITVDGESFAELIKQTCDEVLSYGRFGMLIDKDGDQGDPYIAPYTAENIFNWRTEKVDGKDKLVLLVLHETVMDNINDEYEANEIHQIRVLRLFDYEDEDRKETKSVLEVETWRYYGSTDKHDETGGYRLVEGPIMPEIAGKKLDFIPFIFFGASSNTVKPNIPPLLDLAYLNIYHWQKSVDLSHGLHFTALPTPWAAGFPDKQKLYIGPTHAWVSRDPAARCGYLEFSGEGLKALENNLEKTEFHMAALGARMIDHPRKGVESAETARLRQASETSTLITVSNLIETGLVNALKLYAKWLDIKDTDDVKVSMNKDFVELPISAQKILALLQALQAGTITLETYLYNMKSGEVLPPDQTVEEEIKLLEKNIKKDEPHEIQIRQFADTVESKSNISDIDTSGVRQIEEIGSVDNKDAEKNELKQNVAENNRYK